MPKDLQILVDDLNIRVPSQVNHPKVAGHSICIDTVGSFEVCYDEEPVLD